MGPSWRQDGPRWGQDGDKMRQDGAKMGQVGFKLAQIEPKLDSSRDLEAILPSSCLHGPSWPRLGGNLEAIWPNLSRQRGFLDSKPRRPGGKPWRSGAGLTECAEPVEDEAFEEEESEEVLGDLARPCHPDYVRGRRIDNGCGASPATPVHS